MASASQERRAYPKLLPCLVCNRPRRATGPGDRIHEGCKRHGASDIEVRSGLRLGAAAEESSE